MRPLGSLVIGKIGDRYGRKPALMAGIFGMAIATGAIGLLPSYLRIGLIAPILFITFRSVQSFFIAGEYTSAAVFVLEHNKDKTPGLLSGIYCMHMTIGALAAAFICTTTSKLPEHYWRLPYLLGALTGVVGLYIRSQVHETPAFLKQKVTQDIPLLDFTNRCKTFFACASVSALFNALYLIPTVLVISLVPLATSIKFDQIMTINTYSTVLYMLLLPCFGYLSDKITSTKSMGISAALVAVFAYPLVALIELNSIEHIALMKICFTVLTAWFSAPFHAWLQPLFHARQRCTSIGFSYAVGSQLGAAMVPLTMWYWRAFNSMAMIYYVLIFWSVLAVIGLYSQRNALKYQ
jgi:MHS family proline/betaine transporter-like MFS transporter